MKKMKYIYRVYIKQHFEYWGINNFFRKGKKEGEDYVSCNYCLILAENKEEAIQKYKNRYYWDDTNLGFWCYYGYEYYEIKNKTNDVEAEQIIYSFDILKKEMKADEFLEYCKQELYPIDVILK